MCGFEITVGCILCSCSSKSPAFTDYLVARVVIVLLNSTVYQCLRFIRARFHGPIHYVFDELSKWIYI